MPDPYVTALRARFPEASRVIASDDEFMAAVESTMAHPALPDMTAPASSTGVGNGNAPRRTNVPEIVEHAKGLAQGMVVEPLRAAARLGLNPLNPGGAGATAAGEWASDPAQFTRDVGTVASTGAGLATGGLAGKALGATAAPLVRTLVSGAGYTASAAPIGRLAAGQTVGETVRAFPEDMLLGTATAGVMHAAGVPLTRVMGGRVSRATSQGGYRTVPPVTDRTVVPPRTTTLQVSPTETVQAAAGGPERAGQIPRLTPQDVTSRGKPLHPTATVAGVKPLAVKIVGPTEPQQVVPASRGGFSVDPSGVARPAGAMVRSKRVFEETGPGFDASPHPMPEPTYQHGSALPAPIDRGGVPMRVQTAEGPIGAQTMYPRLHVPDEDVIYYTPENPKQLAGHGLDEWVVTPNGTVMGRPSDGALVPVGGPRETTHPGMVRRTPGAQEWVWTPRGYVRGGDVGRVKLTPDDWIAWRQAQESPPSPKKGGGTTLNALPFPVPKKFQAVLTGDARLAEGWRHIDSQLQQMDTHSHMPGTMPEMVRQMRRARHAAAIGAAEDTGALRGAGLDKLSDRDAMDVSLASVGAVPPTQLSAAARTAFDAWDAMRHRMVADAQAVGELPAGATYRPDTYLPQRALNRKDLAGDKGADAVAFHREAGTFGPHDPEQMRQSKIDILDHGPQAQDLSYAQWYVDTGRAPNIGKAVEMIRRVRDVQPTRRTIKSGNPHAQKREVNDPFYDPDVRRTLPSYVDRMHAGLSDSEHLGPSYEKVTEAINTLPPEMQSEAWKLVERSRSGMTEPSKGKVSSQTMRNIAALATGPMTAIKKLSAGVPNTMYNARASSIARGAAESFTKAGTDFYRSTGLQHEPSGFLAGAEEATSRLGRLYHAPLNAAVHFDRSRAVTIGRAEMHALADDLLKGKDVAYARKALREEYLVDPDEVIAQGGLTARQERIGAREFASTHEHALTEQDLPPQFSEGTFGRAFGLFKAWPFRQQVLLARALKQPLVDAKNAGSLKEAAPYLRRFGRNVIVAGAVAPATGIAGNAIIDAATGKKEKHSLGETYLRGAGLAAGWWPLEAALRLQEMKGQSAQEKVSSIGEVSLPGMEIPGEMAWHAGAAAVEAAKGRPRHAEKELRALLRQPGYGRLVVASSHRKPFLSTLFSRAGGDSLRIVGPR